MFFIQRACTCVSYQREVYVLLFDQKRRMGDTRTARAFGDFETYVLSRRDCVVLLRRSYCNFAL